MRLQAVGALFGVTACLLHNEPTSYSSPARLSTSRYVSRSESESEQGVKLVVVDAKP